MSDDADDTRATAAAYATAWNQHATTTFPEFFAEDADFVSFQGVWVRGLAAIVQGHAFIFDGLFRNTTLTYLEDAAVMRGSDVCVYRAKWRMAGRAEDGGPFKTRTGMFLFVLQRFADRWRVVALQNTDIADDPNYHA